MSRVLAYLLAVGGAYLWGLWKLRGKELQDARAKLLDDEVEKVTETANKAVAKATESKEAYDGQKDR